MKSINTEITINASKEEVWSVLTNNENYQNWNPFIVESKGRVEKGNRIVNTMKNGNQKMVFKPVIKSVRKNEYFSWLGSLWIPGIFDGYHFFHLEEVSAKKVKLTQGEQFSGLLSGMILKKIKTQTEAEFIKMNEALKQVVEGESVMLENQK
ncbi:SRPBCC domain-containing protein [Flexithrix dorotheae]|uniref:SRPBCC domain-containing protein n=1 Tax=Flexithrix dorotheae TaxID=70993 RepID=UPI000382EE48|nr:SRPBCC domain-containing protein [Flexithrix dorotheae]